MLCRSRAWGFSSSLGVGTRQRGTFERICLDSEQEPGADAAPHLRQDSDLPGPSPLMTEKGHLPIHPLEARDGSSRKRVETKRTTHRPRRQRNEAGASFF